MYKFLYTIKMRNEIKIGYDLIEGTNKGRRSYRYNYRNNNGN